MRQVLGPGAIGKPRGSGWRGRWEGGSGWGKKKEKRKEKKNIESTYFKIFPLLAFRKQKFLYMWMFS